MGKGAISMLLALFVLALIGVGCGSNDSSSSSSPGSTRATADGSGEGALVKTENAENEVSEIKVAGERPKPETQPHGGPPPEELVIEDLKEGTGALVKDNDVVEINDIGYLYKSGKMFENTYDTNDTIYWRLGADEVIEGWEEGLRGMKVGGRRELIIPPSLGFQTGQQGRVPKGETIVYVVDLIKTERAPNAPQSRLEGGVRAKEVTDGEG